MLLAPAPPCRVGSYTMTPTAECVLQDKQSMRKLVSAFCDGIFSYADERKAFLIIDKCVELCEGDEGILSQVVQTKFFGGRTPFYWLLMNRHSKSGIPPLLKRLCQLCDGFSPDTLEDIARSVPRQIDRDLYEVLRESLNPVYRTSTTSFFRDSDQKPTAKITAEGKFMGILDLHVPLFFDRLLLDQEVGFTFALMGSLWTLQAVVKDLPNAGPPELTWSFELTETHSTCAYKSITLQFEREATITLGNSSNGSYRPSLLCTSTQVVDKVPSTIIIPIPDANTKTFRYNPFMSGEMRALMGTLQITDTYTLIF